ncbi:MAG: VIT domain-containing protein [Desulfotomaculales bacterium]
MPLKRTELTGEIIGPLASLRLTQIYGYSSKQCDKVLEAVYRFPLPGDAVINGVRVRFGNAEIVAELKDRLQAESDYERARREGRQASLLTRESPNVFTLHVAGIQPDQDIVVETSYTQLAHVEQRGWALRVPLTTAPRYVRSDESASRHAHGQPLRLMRDPRHRFTLDLKVYGAGDVRSSTHQLAVSPEGGFVRVRLRNGEVIPDRDCVLFWQPRQHRDRPCLQVMLHDDRTSAHIYFLGIVTPPAVSSREQGIPREVILLVDRSGSMYGAKWDAADWAVRKFLGSLKEMDTFTLGLFHDRTRWFSKVPVRAGSNALEDAVKFLRKHTATGGTELGVALEQALALQRTETGRARHLLIITDAQVTDSGRILRLADAEARRPDRRRISVLCIDTAPNASLAAELARRGGGVARFLTSSPEEEDISTALDEVLEDWAQPVLTGLRLRVNRPDVQVADREVTATAGGSDINLGDLPAGRSVWVCGGMPRTDSPEVTFRLLTADGQEQAALRLDSGVEDEDHPAVKALFGAGRIRDLEYLMNAGYNEEDLRAQLVRMGYDPDEVLAGSERQEMVYIENILTNTGEALRNLLVRESLRYGQASDETAFVAVRTESERQVQASVFVANALPAGWPEAFLSCSGIVVCESSPADSGIYDNYTSTSGIVVRSSGLALARRSEMSIFQESRPMQSKVVLFSGIPSFTNNQAVLYDTSQDQGASKLPGTITISWLEVRFPNGDPPLATIDPGLHLLIYVEDAFSPRARVWLKDLIDQGGRRPLNIWIPSDALVRLVLVDPGSSWRDNVPEIELALGWSGPPGSGP